MAIRVLLSLCIVVLATTVASAQASATLEIPVAFANGEFNRDSPNTWGSGVSVNVVGPVNNSPLHIGGEFTYLNYGIVTDDIEIELNNFFYDGTRTRNHVMLTLSSLARYRIPTQSVRFRPFIDAQLGLRYIFSKQSLLIDGDVEPLDRIKDIAHWVGVFGFGTGVDYAITQETALTLRFVYQAGTRADYARRGSFDTDIDGNETARFSNSRMDMFKIAVGITGLIDAFYE